MMNYLHEIWKCRYFWLSLVRMDLRTRYRRSVLGVGWSLLNPIAMTAVLTTVFVGIFKQTVEGFAPYLLAGLAMWQYVLTVSLHGCQCFFQGEQYIRQHPAPLAIYPLRTALEKSIHFLLALGVVIVLASFFKGLPGPVAILSLIPSVCLLFLLGWGLAVLSGFCNVIFQDTQHLAEVGFQILFYATPIIYPKEVLEKMERGSLAWIMNYNPLVSFLKLVREPILDHHAPSLATFATAGATVLVIGIAAGTMLVRQQKRLIFYL